MARNKNTKNKRTGLRAPSGRVAPVALVLATKMATLVGVLVAYYVIAFFSAVRVVPMIMGFVKDGTGVSMGMPVETVLAVWIAPSLFLIALLFGLVFMMMRKLWHLRRRFVDRVSAWALGRETGLAPATPIPETIRTHPRTRPNKRAVPQSA